MKLPRKKVYIFHFADGEYEEIAPGEAVKTDRQAGLLARRLASEHKRAVSWTWGFKLVNDEDE